MRRAGFCGFGAGFGAAAAASEVGPEAGDSMAITVTESQSICQL